MKHLALPLLAATLACSAPPGPVDAQEARGRTFATDTRLLDVLFVVDNSGSMAEEQQALVRAFFEQDPAVCPIADVAHIPSPFQNVQAGTISTELAGCGLLQLLGAEGYDWRVGIITTDVGLCDDRLPAAEGNTYCDTLGAGAPECSGPAGAPWGFHPQRGCLQPGGPPDSGAPKIVDATNESPAQWFADTLSNIRTFGSPWERGLDAAEIFLDGKAQRAPGCDDDLATFRRDDAELLVIMLTDEDDCSRADTPWVLDENASAVCGENGDFYAQNPALCQTDAGSLPAASSFAERLLSREPSARVVVIGGAVDGDASGCLVRASEDPADEDGAVASDVCFASGGLSNFTAAGMPCGEGSEADAQGLACCTADPATRYEQYVDELGARGKLMSICEPSLLPQVRDIALALIGTD